MVCEQILPGVRIIIANPETKGPMGESHLGEVCFSYESLFFLTPKQDHGTTTIISTWCNSWCRDVFVDLGAQRPQRQRLLHRLRRRGLAVGPFQLQTQLRRHADRLGSDRIPGLPPQDRTDRRQRRWGRVRSDQVDECCRCVPVWGASPLTGCTVI